MSDVREKTVDEVFCSSCGAITAKNAQICDKCGCRQEEQNIGIRDISSNWLTLLLLSFFLDRFYVGKIGTGILKLITGGGFGVWWLIDLIFIFMEKFTDKNGNIISRA